MSPDPASRRKSDAAGGGRQPPTARGVAAPALNPGLRQENRSDLPVDLSRPAFLPAGRDLLGRVR